MTLHRNFINGEWLEGKSVRENINPSDITDIVGEYTQADKAQTQAAIAAARAAQPGWAATTPQQRADALEFIGTELLARKDEIGRLLSREEGSPWPTALPKPCEPHRFSNSMPRKPCGWKVFQWPR